MFLVAIFKQGTITALIFRRQVITYSQGRELIDDVCVIRMLRIRNKLVSPIVLNS